MRAGKHIRVSGGRAAVVDEVGVRLGEVVVKTEWTGDKGKGKLRLIAKSFLLSQYKKNSISLSSLATSPNNSYRSYFGFKAISSFILWSGWEQSELICTASGCCWHWRSIFSWELLGLSVLELLILWRRGPRSLIWRICELELIGKLWLLWTWLGSLGGDCILWTGNLYRSWSCLNLFFIVVILSGCGRGCWSENWFPFSDYRRGVIEWSSNSLWPGWFWCLHEDFEIVKLGNSIKRACILVLTCLGRAAYCCCSSS